ncbi:MAG: aromatic-ring-hydroxylating dioxygenase subunit beta [Porticoccaceae bacterium]
MNGDINIWQQVQRFLGQEALYLDTKEWDSWLALYDKNAEYWMPAWTDDEQLSSDPRREVSLIYYSNRAGLEDRVTRITGGLSGAANIEVRTSHNFTVLDVKSDDGILNVISSWQVSAFLNGSQSFNFGRAEYRICDDSQRWSILSKKTIILNDIPEILLDVYLV